MGFSIANVLKRNIVPLIGKPLINSISSSLSMKVVGFENYQFLKERGMPCVIVFWHGQQFYPIYYFRDRKIAIMVSLSQDGEMQNRILTSFGYSIVRGSSSRGAVSGLIGLIRKIREGCDVAIALDGPRGPYHAAKEGVNYIAIKENCYVIPVACGFVSYRQFSAWDKYILPYPMTKGLMMIGRPFLPNALNLPMMTHKYLEKILNSMTEEIDSTLHAENPDMKKIIHVPTGTEPEMVGETAETKPVVENENDVDPNKSETKITENKDTGKDDGK